MSHVRLTAIDELSEVLQLAARYARRRRLQDAWQDVLATDEKHFVRLKLPKRLNFMSNSRKQDLFTSPPPPGHSCV